MAVLCSDPILFTVLEPEPAERTGVRVKVYDKDDPTVLLAVLGRSKNREWLDGMNEPGAGSFQIHKDDPVFDLVPDVLTYGNIVRMELDGVDRFAFEIESKSRSTPGEGEHGDEWITVSGKGVLGLLADAVLYQAGGLKQRSPRERVFTFASLDYDVTSWGNAVQLFRQDDVAQDAHPVKRGFPWDWPDPTAWWIWDRHNGVGSAPNDELAPIGLVYFAKDFTLAEAKDLSFVVTADDGFELYVDGQPVLNATEPFSWMRPFRVDLSLDAGTHRVAVRGENVRRPYGESAAAIIVAVGSYSLGDWTTESREAGDPPPWVPLLVSDNTWKCLGYPDKPPALTPGEVLRTTINEAKARGVKTIQGLTYDFADDVDTYAFGWEETVDSAIGVGTDMLTVLQKLTDSVCDVTMSPDLVLSAYNKVGLDRTVTSSHAGAVVLRPAKNILGGEYSENGEIKNTVLAEYGQGYAERWDHNSLSEHGRRETFLALNDSESEAQVDRVLAKLWEEVGQPSPTMTATIYATAGAEPYVDFGLGDWVYLEILGEERKKVRVRSISVREDEEGNIFFEPELASVPMEAALRHERWLNVMANGTLRGRVMAASPAFAAQGGGTGFAGGQSASSLFHTHAGYVVGVGTKKLTVSDTAPASPEDGDLWVDTSS